MHPSPHSHSHTFNTPQIINIPAQSFLVYPGQDDKAVIYPIENEDFVPLPTLNHLPLLLSSASSLSSHTKPKTSSTEAMLSPIIPPPPIPPRPSTGVSGTPQLNPGMSRSHSNSCAHQSNATMDSTISPNQSSSSLTLSNRFSEPLLSRDVSQHHSDSSTSRSASQLLQSQQGIRHLSVSDNTPLIRPVNHYAGIPPPLLNHSRNLNPNPNHRHSHANSSPTYTHINSGLFRGYNGGTLPVSVLAFPQSNSMPMPPSNHTSNTTPPLQLIQNSSETVESSNLSQTGENERKKANLNALLQLIEAENPGLFNNSNSNTNANPNNRHSSISPNPRMTGAGTQGDLSQNRPQFTRNCASEHIEKKSKVRPALHASASASSAVTSNSNSNSSNSSVISNVAVLPTLFERNNTRFETGVGVGSIARTLPNTSFMDASALTKTMSALMSGSMSATMSGTERVTPDPIPTEDVIMNGNGILCGDASASASASDERLNCVTTRNDTSSRKIRENPSDGNSNSKSKSSRAQKKKRNSTRKKKTSIRGYISEKLQDLLPRACDNKFVCPEDECTREYKSKESLARHYRVHTPWAFTCEICDKKYARKQDLNEHRRVHTGERPFPCHICEKSFKQRHNLVDHIRTHTGERPFQCDVCHKRFSIKYNLKVHRTQLHGPGKSS